MTQSLVIHTLLLGLLSSGACGKSDSKAKAQGESSNEVDSLGSAAALITLESAGKGQALARIYNPSVGKRSATLVQKVAVAQLPPDLAQTLRISLDWKRPKALGQPWTFAVSNVESDNMIPDEVDEDEKAIGNTIFAAFKMIRGAVHADDSMHFRFVQTAGLPVQPSLIGGLHALVVPFPEEPIGIGAKWQVREELQMHGMIGQHTRSYELRSSESSVMTVRVTARTEWKPETAADPDQGAETLGATDTMSGLVHVDLRDLLPQAGEVSSVLTVRTRVRLPGESDDDSGVRENTVNYSLLLEPASSSNYPMQE